jgi:hypothetical protein
LKDADWKPKMGVSLLLKKLQSRPAANRVLERARVYLYVNAESDKWGRDFRLFLIPSSRPAKVQPEPLLASLHPAAKYR